MSVLPGDTRTKLGRAAATTTAVADGTRVESEKSRAGPLRGGKRRRGRNDSLKITSHFLDPLSIRANGRVYVAVG